MIERRALALAYIALAGCLGCTGDLPPNAEGDCPAICGKLVACKHGPWDNEADCRLACEASFDDETSAATYRCAAAATSCSRIQRCGR